MDLGIEIIRRETFLSALDLSREVLRGLGFADKEVEHTVETFRDFDQRRLYEDYAHYTDQEKLAAQAKKQSQELEELFTLDASESDHAAAGSDKQ